MLIDQWQGELVVTASTMYHMSYLHELLVLFYNLDCPEWQPRRDLCVWDENILSARDGEWIVDDIHWHVVRMDERILMRISEISRFSNRSDAGPPEKHGGGKSSRKIIVVSKLLNNVGVHPIGPGMSPSTFQTIWTRSNIEGHVTLPWWGLWISNGGFKKRAEKGEFFCRYRRMIDSESCGRLEGRVEVLCYRWNRTGNLKCYLILIELGNKVWNWLPSILYICSWYAVVTMK